MLEGCITWRENDSNAFGERHMLEACTTWRENDSNTFGEG